MPSPILGPVNVILCLVRRQFALGSMDAIVIIPKSTYAYSKMVRKFLTLLLNANFVIQLKGCKLFTKTIEYLGNVIRPGQLAYQKAPWTEFSDLKLSTSISALQLYLGICNASQRFVSG